MTRDAMQMCAVLAMAVLAIAVWQCTPTQAARAPDGGPVWQTATVPPGFDAGAP
jgi:hypothetical protein